MTFTRTNVGTVRVMFPRPESEKEIRFGAQVAVKADRLVRHASIVIPDMVRRAKSGKKSEGKAHDFLAHSGDESAALVRTRGYSARVTNLLG